jgi:hypothetical protein
VVTEDWAFLLHRLPMARAAGFDVHVATIALRAAGSHRFRDLRRIHSAIAPALVHRVAVEPIVIDAIQGLATRSSQSR